MSDLLCSLHPAVSAFPEMAVGSACASSFSRLARKGVKSCPRAGCGKTARPVRCGDGRLVALAAVIASGLLNRIWESSETAAARRRYTRSPLDKTGLQKALSRIHFLHVARTYAVRTVLAEHRPVALSRSGASRSRIIRMIPGVEKTSHAGPLFRRGRAIPSADAALHAQSSKPDFRALQCRAIGVATKQRIPRCRFAQANTRPDHSPKI